ncbi:DNA adenine methylase [Niabella sp.]|uniref:DNA adenine methylase n=1 Tax=Niabella sp. TaxID=1962976 RepID=UPI002630C54B|nr:DNA adenine methylase [Niabella sp.]
MKTPITYYGGKQKLAPIILELIPPHILYAEAFAGGAAIFFAKPPSAVEVLNDTNGELINFYRVIKDTFSELLAEIESTLHSRKLHKQAWVVYSNPELFSPVKRAWAVWVLSSQGFAGQLANVWGYDIEADSTSRKIFFNKKTFTELYCQRLEKVQLESTDALYIIRSRDSKDSFFYCDPPYFNSHLGHYKGYTKKDFEDLLQHLSALKGKFLLSSYPSKLLQDYTHANNWSTLEFEQLVTVNVKHRNEKKKIEVLTANYPLERQPQPMLF